MVTGPDRFVLESIVTGQFQIISKGGAKILTGSAIGGSSFTFQVPPDMTTTEIMSRAEEAIELFDSVIAQASAQTPPIDPKILLNRWLSSRPLTRVAGRF